MEWKFDFVEHTVKVTYLGDGKYGCRVFVNGVLSQERTVFDKADIGKTCREMLRTENKCGNLSDFGHKSRHRATKKELARSKKE